MKTEQLKSIQYLIEIAAAGQGKISDSERDTVLTTFFHSKEIEVTYTYGGRKTARKIRAAIGKICGGRLMVVEDGNMKWLLLSSLRGYSGDKIQYLLDHMVE